MRISCPDFANFIGGRNTKYLKMMLASIPRRFMGKTTISTSFTMGFQLRHISDSLPAPQIVSRLRLLPKQEVTAEKSASSSWLTPIGSAFKSKKKVDVEEKPWPLSVRIAGYCAVAAAVPLSLCTMVAEVKSLREWLEGNRPHDPNDRRLGKKMVHFARAYWAMNGLFEGETKFVLEQEQTTALEIAKNTDRDITVQLYTTNQPVMNMSLRGDVPIHSPLAAAGFENDSKTVVAIEFPIDEDIGLEGEEATWAVADANADKFSKQDSDEIDVIIKANFFNNSSVKADYQAYGRMIRKLTQTFSSWHVFEQDLVSESKSYIEKMSPENIRKSELEWREAQLQMQLIDPYCTRDIDEMQDELVRIRRELRKLNRWRWVKSIASRSSS